jgi:hypothetical protein
MLADVHLEHVGAALRELADRIGGVFARRLDRRLVDESVSPTRQRVREHRNYLGAGPQRQRRQRRRRRRGAPEEVHPDRVRAVHVLIDQQRHPFAGVQRLQHAPHRTLAVDHRVAGLGPHPLEQVVEPRVVEDAGEHADRPQLHRVRQRMQLPEPEVTGEEQDALALGIRQSHALVAFVFGAGHHLLGRERRKRQQLQQHAPEVLECGARDRSPLARGLVREALFEIGKRNAAVLPVDDVEHHADRGAPEVDYRFRQPPRHRAHGDHRPVLNRVPHCSTAVTDANKESGGSNCTASGTR